MPSLIYMLLLFLPLLSFADDSIQRDIQCQCDGATSECQASLKGLILMPGWSYHCEQSTDIVNQGCNVFKKDQRGVLISTYACNVQENCPAGYFSGTCVGVLNDPQMKDYTDRAIANNGGKWSCRDYTTVNGKPCAYVVGGQPAPPPPPTDSGSSGDDSPLQCPYDPVNKEYQSPMICHGTISGTSYTYQCCHSRTENCCTDGSPPGDCPEGWGGGGCNPDEHNCIDITIDAKGNDGQYLKCKLTTDPECPQGSCEPPGSGSDDPTGGSGSDNPTGGSGSDNPQGGSGSDNPTGGGGGTLPGDVPGDSGGSGSGNSNSSGTGGKGKDADKDGNCPPGFIPTADIKNENETYCRPTGTTEPNSEGKCPDGWELSKDDSRFCVKKDSEPKECPSGQFYEEGTGCKNNGDPCPKGKVQDPATKECVLQIEGNVDAGPPKPGAITIFDVCKQPKSFLTPEVQALCNLQDATKKDAQQKKDAEYLEGLGKQLKDFVKSDVKDFTEKMDITKLYSGVFVPFESFITDSPECPLQQVEIPTINIFGQTLDLNSAFRGENNKLACDVFAAMRIIFLLGVYYFGFRLIFKALTGV